MNRERVKAANARLTNELLEGYSEELREVAETQPHVAEGLEILGEKGELLQEKADKYVRLLQRANKQFKVR